MNVSHNPKHNLVSSGHQQQRERLNTYENLTRDLRSMTQVKKQQQISTRSQPRHAPAVRQTLQDSMFCFGGHLGRTSTKTQQNSKFLGVRLPCTSPNEIRLKTRRASGFAKDDKKYNSHRVLAATAASRSSRVLGGEVFPSSPRPCGLDQVHA